MAYLEITVGDDSGVRVLKRGSVPSLRQL